jgi:hypothetical protein
MQILVDQIRQSLPAIGASLFQHIGWQGVAVGVAGLIVGVSVFGGVAKKLCSRRGLLASSLLFAAAVCWWMWGTASNNTPSLTGEAADSTLAELGEAAPEADYAMSEVTTPKSVASAASLAPMDGPSPTMGMMGSMGETMEGSFSMPKPSIPHLSSPHLQRGTLQHIVKHHPSSSHIATRNNSSAGLPAAVHNGPPASGSGPAVGLLQTPHSVASASIKGLMSGMGSGTTGMPASQPASPSTGQANGMTSGMMSGTAGMTSSRPASPSAGQPNGMMGGVPGMSISQPGGVSMGQSNGMMGGGPGMSASGSPGRKAGQPSGSMGSGMAGMPSSRTPSTNGGQPSGMAGMSSSGSTGRSGGQMTRAQKHEADWAAFNRMQATNAMLNATMGQMWHPNGLPMGGPGMPSMSRMHPAGGGHQPAHKR